VKPRFLGLDLAWSEKNPSGLAALDENGRLIALCAERRSDEDVLAWIRSYLAPCGAIAIDMPTIVVNPAGQRDCEQALRADFYQHHAGPYPANTRLRPFTGGGRAHRLLEELVKDDRVVHTGKVAPHDARTVAFETFPHPATVELFGLNRIIPYKKKGRPWPGVLAAWSCYRAFLAGLENADPPLLIGPEIDFPPTVPQDRYKRRDDEIDAVLCAYVASYVWRHGTDSAKVRVYGDMATGHIVIPWRREAAMKRTLGG
jgi:predicted RNase H-like nuclease